MGNSVLRVIHRLQILLVILGCLLLVGCPGDNRLEFITKEGKKTKELSINMLDGRASLKLTVIRKFSMIYQDYSVWLAIKVNYLDGYKGFSHDVTAIKLDVAGNCCAQSLSLYSNTVYHKGPIDYNITVPDFECQLGPDYIKLDEKGKAISLSLTFILDDFMFYDGKPIHIDTIHVIDKGFAQ